MSELRGAGVLVTGGGSGIGLAAARLFAQRGARVVITGRTAKRLEAAASERITPHPADVRRPAELDAAVTRVLELADRLDVVVSNAGVFQAEPLASLTDDETDRIIATNLVGAINVARASLPALRASRGALLHVGSTYGHRAAPGASLYAASKAAIESLTRSWAVELAADGVRVNAVAPGPVATGVLRAAGLSPAQAEAHQAAIASAVPLRRIGQPEEVAEILVALASAPWVTGAIWDVDGGLAAA